MKTIIAFIVISITQLPDKNYLYQTQNINNKSEYTVISNVKYDIKDTIYYNK